MDAAELLDRTADLIEERGHAKYLLEDHEGHVCLLGGMNLALVGRATGYCQDASEKGQTAVAAQLALFDYLGLEMPKPNCGCGSPSCNYTPELGRRMAVVNWNNEDEREPSEVIDACRHTAKVLRGG